MPDYLSKQCKNLIRRMLDINSTTRISMPELKNHSFMRIMRFQIASRMQKNAKQSNTDSRRMILVKV